MVSTSSPAWIYKAKKTGIVPGDGAQQGGITPVGYNTKEETQPYSCTTRWTDKSSADVFKAVDGGELTGGDGCDDGDGGRRVLGTGSLELLTTAGR